MTLIWIILIIGLFMFLVKSGIIERYTSNVMIGGADEGVSTEPAPTSAESANEIIYESNPEVAIDEYATDYSGVQAESDYQFPTRELELGRDSGAEADRGNFKIPNREEIEKINQLVGVEDLGTEGANMGMPESSIQAVPIPQESTHNMINDGAPLPTYEVSNEIAPALGEELRAGMTIGANGEPLINTETPSLSQFKNIGVARVNRLNNVNVIHPNGLLGAEAADDEFQCISSCKNNDQCGMYSYQPKQQICHLYQKPGEKGLNQFLERNPTYHTGIISRSRI